MITLNETNATPAACGPECKDTRGLFSSYLDGAVSGVEMQAVSGHMDACADCRNEFETWRGMQSVLARMGQAKAPADLGLKLRLAISHEHARQSTRWFDGLSLRWDNLLRPMLVQVSAGLAGAVLLIGTVSLLLGVVATPDAVLANDEPLGALTAPHYRYSVAQPRSILTTEDATIVVQASINSQGRVYDYTILSGPNDAATDAQVANQLMLEVFEPARVFGEPVKGRVIVTFEGMSVHG